MNLTSKNITRKMSDYNEICNFIKRAFPKEELMPMWFMRLLCKMKKYNFRAYYDHSQFVGILFTIETKDTLFVNYIAVNDAVRSIGYGSKLLQTLFESYPNRTVTLFIETMDDIKANNYEQRVKRLAFYEKNGFIQTGIKAGFKTPFVDILSTDIFFNEEKAKRVIRPVPMKIFTDNDAQKK